MRNEDQKHPALMAVRCALTLALLWISSAIAADLRSVEQLPVDRFDEYMVDSFPLYPWQRLGGESEGVRLDLSATGESPFVGNRISGKGLVLVDTSVSAGSGTGAVFRFVPPPSGRFSLEFDFMIPAPVTTKKNADTPLDFVCQLAAANEAETITLHLGSGGKLALTAAEKTTELTTILPETWYHLLLLSNGDNLLLKLVDIKNVIPDKNKVRIKTEAQVFRTTIACRSSGKYNRLSFFSNGADSATGAWMIDNVCMAGDVAADRSDWLPFVKAPLAELRKSKRKVYAYYFIFGTAANEQYQGFTWYTRAARNPSLNTKKEREKAGSELLLTPLPRAPLPDELSEGEKVARTKEEEVQLAIAMGIDGFSADFHTTLTPSGGFPYFTQRSVDLMDAAVKTDPAFKILPGVYADESTDSNGKKNCDPIAYANAKIIQTIARHPATLRTEDGRFMLSMWMTERLDVEWWQKVLAELEKNGTPAALVGHFNTGGIAQFAPICYAMARWGSRSPGKQGWPDQARSIGAKKIVFPVAFQDVRTRGTGCPEAQNSALLRSNWEQAIEDKDVEWVFLNTWSDYTETPLAPSTFIGFFPYDMNTYYTQWFKTGVQPTIIRDRLYYVYRRHHTDNPTLKGVTWSSWKTTPRNEIELLAFLKEPGQLTIEVNGKQYTQDAPAGMTSFRAPLPADVTFTPTFTLKRGGATVVSEPGRHTVMAQTEYPHMIYCAGIIAAQQEP